MKTRVVILLSMLAVFLLLGWWQTGGGMASPDFNRVGIEIAPKPTQVMPTQPLPPAVETGANAPLVCGAIVLLIIILGGVVWNVKLKKHKPADH